MIDYLIENYYKQSPDQVGVLSSHWKLYAGRAKINLDFEGNLSSLTGEGFGVHQFKSLHHRLLEYLAVGMHLMILPRRSELLGLINECWAVVKRMGLDPGLDYFRQICTLDLIRRNMPNNAISNRFNVLMIGDGYGVLAAVIKHFFPNAMIFLLDLGKILLFQSYHCLKAFPARKHILADKPSGAEDVDFVYCPADHLDWLENYRFDLAVNVASMQEMKPKTVDDYFNFLRNHMNPDHLFYCCNREEKRLPDGEISRFYDYPWSSGDRHILEEECPWHRFFLSYWPTARSPKLLGLRVPLIQFYDGKHLHRLTILKT